MIDQPSSTPDRNHAEAAGEVPEQAKASEQAKAQGRARGWVIAAVIAALITAAAAYVVSRHPEVQHQAIRIERLKRHLMWRAGFQLAGTPEFASLEKRLTAQGLKLGAPIFIRIFKREFQLEVWLKRDGRFHLFQAYPICKWSGRLGPKLKQGDHQSPEGFYTVAAGAMNPNSRWHRSFNLGFPNAYDRQHGRTGSYLMVHGGCSSVGCYAMTNDAVDEIWKLTTSAHKRGQRRFHVHAYPFRMSGPNIALHSGQPWSQFWQDLKNGHDAFELTGLPPRVYACKGRYMVSALDDARSNGSHRIRRTCPPPHRRFTPARSTAQAN